MSSSSAASASTGGDDAAPGEEGILGTKFKFPFLSSIVLFYPMNF